MYTNKDALAMFKEGFNCCQIVFAHFASDLGIDKDTALKIASGFGAGMGRMAHTCGAVTGAFMVISLNYGYSSGANADSKENVYGMVREFAGEFKARHHSIICRELLGMDISSPSEYAEAREKDIFRTACPEYVKDAIQILQKALAKD